MPYVYGSGVPYGKYLQAQSLVDDLKGAQTDGLNRISLALEAGTRKLVASQEALQDKKIQLLHAVKDGFDQLSWNMQEARGAIEELNATFVWGFNTILCHTGRMADSLEALLAVAKTPTKTRAYEYFDDARVAFRRGHHRDALDLIEKAISGDHTSSGYRLEWRFHLLKGSILVGTVSHPEFLDLKSAEESYRAAADYAATDDPKGAALGLLGASWACYCQGQFPEALTLSERALKSHPSFGEPLFQSAKILMAMGRPDEALPRLVAAIEEDPQYLLKAAGDGDFQAQGVQFEAWSRGHGETKQRQLLNLYRDISEHGRFWLQSVEQQADLGPVERTLTRKEPPLFDLLCALSTLRSIEFANRRPPDGPSDALKVVCAVPAQLQLPRRLLASLAADSKQWDLDSHFFDFAHVLLKRGEFDSLRAIFADYPEKFNSPLELFAARIETFPSDPSANSELAKAIETMAPSKRKDLIDQFEKLKRSSRYSGKTIEGIRAAVIRQYDRWLPSIQEELRKSAFTGTEHPGKGVIGRLLGGFFGFLIPAAIIEWTVGSGLATLLFFGGITALVVPGVVKRINIREKRLQAAQDNETALRGSLDSRVTAP